MALLVDATFIMIDAAPDWEAVARLAGDATPGGNTWLQGKPRA